MDKQVKKAIENMYADTYKDKISNPESVTNLRLHDQFSDKYFPDLTDFANLKELDLSVNDFSKYCLGRDYEPKLPDSLEQLSLRNSNLLRLPDWIGKLSNLKYLNLSNNTLSFEEYKGQYLTRLKTGEHPTSLVGMIFFDDFSTESDYQNFKSNIEQLSELTKLEVLKLDSCKLYKLPNELNKLVNLKELILSSNEFSDFSNITALANLEKLDLSSNWLGVLPESISCFTELRYLNLSNNGLTHLPDAICHLSKLETLMLANNKIEELPIEVSDLTGLRVINLDYNNLTEMPDSFVKNLKDKGDDADMSFKGNKFRALAIPECEYRKLSTSYVVKKRDMRFRILDKPNDAIERISSIDKKKASKNPEIYRV